MVQRKSFERYTRELLNNKAMVEDKIISTMLKRHMLQQYYNKLEEKGYSLIIENIGAVTKYKLCKIIEIHTLTETIDNNAIKVEVDKFDESIIGIN